MKKIFNYLIIVFVILCCVSCTNKNIDLEDIYNDKLPLYEKDIVLSMSLLVQDSGNKPIEKYEFVLIDKTDSEDMNSVIYKKVKNMLGKHFIKALIFVDKTNNVEYTFATQYKNNLISKYLENQIMKTDNIAQYRYENILMSYFCYSYFLAEDYSEIDGIYMNNNGTTLLGVNDVDNISCLPKTKYIAAYSFRDNLMIKSLKSNEKMETIFWYAFYGASNLKHVDLNNGLERIKDYAFYDTSLEYIVIPKGVKEIGKKVFNCGNIFVNEYMRPDGWRYDFAVEDATVYYAGQWEYNEEGIPKPLIN